MSTPMQRAPDPDLAYLPIPKERYLTREFAACEWQHMWSRVWLMAGRASDIPLAAFHFDDEKFFPADEIHNVRPDDLLTVELELRHPLRAKVLLQPLFSVSLI